MLLKQLVSSCQFFYTYGLITSNNVIHPIHRFKSPDWLKEGHMTWISFDNVHVRKLIHVCYTLSEATLSKYGQFIYLFIYLLFTISMTLGEAVTAAEFGTFMVQYGQQNL